MTLSVPRTRIALLLLWTFLSACSHDVTVRYPDNSGNPASTLTIMMDSATAMTVAINGILLVDDERTKRVDIQNMPPGFAEVSVSAGGNAQQARVWVSPDHATTIPMGSPGSGGPSVVSTLLSTALSVAMYMLMRRI
jgi:hypothetical protein